MLSPACVYMLDMVYTALSRRLPVSPAPIQFEICLAFLLKEVPLTNVTSLKSVFPHLRYF